MIPTELQEEKGLLQKQRGVLCALPDAILLWEISGKPQSQGAGTLLSQVMGPCTPQIHQVSGANHRWACPGRARERAGLMGQPARRGLCPGAVLRSGVERAWSGWFGHCILNTWCAINYLSPTPLRGPLGRKTIKQRCAIKHIKPQFHGALALPELNVSLKTTYTCIKEGKDQGPLSGKFLEATNIIWVSKGGTCLGHVDIENFFHETIF